MMEALAFYATAALILISALGVVLCRNLVHSAMSLALSFLGVAVIYILLHAFFLFGVQVLIYVGAITVLIMFGIMLTRDVEGNLVQQTNRQHRMAAASALATFIALTYIAFQSHFNVTNATPGDSVVGIGVAFISRYVVPFEVASLVLLVALVGAIVIARDKEVD